MPAGHSDACVPRLHGYIDHSSRDTRLPPTRTAGTDVTVQERRLHAPTAVRLMRAPGLACPSATLAG